MIFCLHREEYERKRKEARTEGYLQASITGSRNKKMGIVEQKNGGIEEHELGMYREAVGRLDNSRWTYMLQHKGDTARE